MEGFIEFTTIDPNFYGNKVKELLARNNNKIQEAIHSKNFQYSTFIKPLEEWNEELLTYFTPLANLNSVLNTPETEKIYQENDLLLTEYFTVLSQNEDIYNVYKEILQKEGGSLNQEQLRVLVISIRNFELGGVNLPKDKKDRLKELNLKLSELSNTFSQNLLKATNEYQLVVRKEKHIKELPESDRKLAEIEDNGKKAWKFTLQMPSYLAYMTYGSKRKLRKKLEKAYSSRAPENGKLIEEILKLRKEQANILGFSNYAELSLKTKIASSPKKVIEFLQGLAEKGKKFGVQEIEELKKFAKKQGFSKKLRTFDRLYFAEKLKKAKYDLDEAEYRPYLEKESVTNGLLAFLKTLLGIEFIKVDVTSWHSTVQTYHLHKNGKLFGRLYMDLEARKDKKGGAWLQNWQTHYEDSFGVEHPASAFIVANFSPSTPEQPSLLKPSDVVTLFHEMGHALQHLCSEVKELSISGISNVEWDAVEFPSQFLENFAYTKQVLNLFAKHYKTGETLPEPMIQRLVDARNFLAGIALLRQLEFGMFDMLIHTEECFSEEQVQFIMDTVREKLSVMKTPKYNKFQNGFSHIFSGGYAAGYYSYKWAELLSADAFLEFINKGVFNQELANRYYDHILKRGGSEDAMNLFKKFLGREPDIEALLKLYGME